MYIKVSKSQDIFSPIFSRSVKRDLVITTDYIFIPASKQEEDVIRRMNSLPHDLKSIGLNVSTGKVVDFRIRDFLCSSPSQNTYPMIYPSNISESIVVHPLERCKKPQWFLGDPEAAKLLVPPGSYVVVKRFSAKEERKRIVAAVWKSSSESAIDNKLNYFHFNGLPLSSKTALGLTKWLNSKFVDSYFRIFSGHTQVNATDLRKMKYPSLEELHELADKDDGWVDNGYFD
ncbi:MAG: hypothetical protein GX849_08175 [Clostridiaceae bacterium]|nr:hypothetical protein [Clostridiaceae bacterium]